MKVAPGSCQTCGREIAGDVESRGQEHQPRANDVGVCLHCGTVFVFVKRDRLLVREMPSEEQMALIQDAMPEVNKVHRFLTRRNRLGGFQS